MKEPIDSELVAQLATVGGILFSALLGVLIGIVLWRPAATDLEHLARWPRRLLQPALVLSFGASTISVLIATVCAALLNPALSRWGSTLSPVQEQRVNILYVNAALLFQIGLFALLLAIGLVGFLRSTAIGFITLVLAIIATVVLSSVLY